MRIEMWGKLAVFVSSCGCVAMSVLVTVAI